MPTSFILKMVTTKSIIWEELRLLNQYNRTKLKELEKTLRMLIEFSRDDLKRLDKLEKIIKEKLAE